MQIKLIQKEGGKRTFAVILHTGDEAMRCLGDFAARERIGGAQVTAIGAFRAATLAFFDWEAKQYRPIPVAEQTEVASSRAKPLCRRQGAPIPPASAAPGPRAGGAEAAGAAAGGGGGGGLDERDALAAGDHQLRDALAARHRERDGRPG